MLVQIVLWVLLGVVVVIAIAAIFLATMLYYSYKFLWNMPFMQWVTLEETVHETRVPKLLCMGFLMSLYEGKHLEVRILPDTEESMLELIRLKGFKPYTIEFHEFRLTTKPRRRKKRTNTASFMKKYFPDFEPPALPA